MKVTSRPVRRAAVRETAGDGAGEGAAGVAPCVGAVEGPLSDMRISSLFICFTHP